MSLLQKTLVMGAIISGSFLTTQNAVAQGLHNSATKRESRKAQRDHARYTKRLIKDGKIDKEIVDKNLNLDFSGYRWNAAHTGYTATYMSEHLVKNYQNQGTMFYDIDFEDVDRDGRPSAADTVNTRTLYLGARLKNGNTKVMKAVHQAGSDTLDIDIQVFDKKEQPLEHDPKNKFFSQYSLFMLSNPTFWVKELGEQANIAGSRKLKWHDERALKTGPATVMQHFEGLYFNAPKTLEVPEYRDPRYSW